MQRFIPESGKTNPKRRKPNSPPTLQEINSSNYDFFLGSLNDLGINGRMRRARGYAFSYNNN